ncbi:ATP-dependent endonuclease [Rhizobium sp. S-51]|uniref:ATP-dependent endonuclease n=1 Tax=Rhizobium terricola TaxID=2728849 RepID=A0A7Y0AUX6_9HYPH|nr:ATP-dependent endonuclease [Rhizobium terricola]
MILVEGETDRYFFRALLQERHLSLEQEISVLHVGGKGQLQKWRSLFTSFGLRVYAIADFDYIVNLHYRESKSTKLKTTAQISEFKRSNPDWEQHLINLRKDRIFILSEGNLEIYLGTEKDLSHVIEFCQNRLTSFLSDETSSRSSEVKSIIDTIATE